MSMSIQDLWAQARDMITVKRVFGEPYEKYGVTIIPAAIVIGGLGGGEGEGPPSVAGERPHSGSGARGAGAGVIGWPAGVYVIRAGEVAWRPAINVNLVILGGQLVGLVAVLAVRGILKAWLTRRG